MHSFSKTAAESCQKKNLKYENILHNSTELSWLGILKWNYIIFKKD